MGQELRGRERRRRRIGDGGEMAAMVREARAVRWRSGQVLASCCRHGKARELGGLGRGVPRRGWVALRAPVRVEERVGRGSGGGVSGVDEVDEIVEALRADPVVARVKGEREHAAILDGRR